MDTVTALENHVQRSRRRLLHPTRKIPIMVRPVIQEPIAASEDRNLRFAR
jgi:hypothetical protein